MSMANDPSDVTSSLMQPLKPQVVVLFGSDPSAFSALERTLG